MKTIVDHFGLEIQETRLNEILILSPTKQLLFKIKLKLQVEDEITFHKIIDIQSIVDWNEVNKKLKIETTRTNK